MNRRTEEWIQAHPVEAFFLVAIGVCFVLLFPAVLFIPREGMLGQILGFYLGRLGVYSPVLAGMLVARVLRPGRQRVSWARRLSVFLPVWVAAVVIHTASVALSAPPEASLIGLSVISLPVALLPAWVVSSAVVGGHGVRQLLATLVRPRGSTVYYLVALLTFPLVHFVGAGITNVRNGNPWLPPWNQGAEPVLTLFVTFLSVLLFSGGINEEAGWRGFAQKRMQVNHSPLLAILILWLLMVIWHVPNDIVQYRDGGYVMVRIGLYPFIAILFGWIYNRTGGSILAPVIFHASMNSMNPLMGLFPITTAGNILLIGLAVIAVVSDRMWRRLPGDHPAVWQSA